MDDSDSRCSTAVQYGLAVRRCPNNDRRSLGFDLNHYGDAAITRNVHAAPTTRCVWHTDRSLRGTFKTVEIKRTKRSIRKVSEMLFKSICLCTYSNISRDGHSDASLKNNYPAVVFECVLSNTLSKCFLSTT